MCQPAAPHEMKRRSMLCHSVRRVPPPEASSSHPGELHRSNRTQAPIDLKWRPLAQMRRVGKRLPDFFRRVAQFSDENERSLLSVLSYLRPAGRTRCVLLAIGHRAACDLRASWTSWMRLPQVSFSIAMMEAVTSVGGIVNWAPRALIRS